MSLKGSRTLALAAFAGVFLASASASAQVDVRLIRPDVMVLLDTSGSMEFVNSALNDTCTGPDAAACMRCSNGASLCSPGCPASEARNRWATAIEVLTGSIQNFSCTRTDRNNPAEYDYLYQFPHHVPLSNNVPLYHPNAVQADDGILDTYADRVRFGLMTFDNDNRRGINAYDGMFSYASDRAYRARGCADPATLLNLGAKRASTDDNTSDIVPGGLVSVGPSNADTATLSLINRRVQESLTGRPAAGSRPDLPSVRPWGPTPIAAMLDDAQTYWTTHPDVTDGSAGGMGDPYFRCRTRANILITDGAPTDYVIRNACQGGGDCPYPPSEQSAMSMSMTGGSNPAVRTYVIAFNANDAAALSALTPIAMAGNTTRVYFANDRPTLAATLSAVIDSVTSLSSTRVPPVFGTSAASNSTGATQYQFNASFNVTPGEPWAGMLVRNRTVCASPGPGMPPVPTDVTPDPLANDDFAYNMRATQRSANSWGPRYLWTFMPIGASTPTHMVAPITNAVSGSAGTATELAGTMSPGLFNYSTMSEVSTLQAWLRGDAGTVRATRPLGDVYRSVPLSVPAPSLSLPDQSFAAYRQRALPVAGRRRTAVTVGTREPMLYVGSNDGILHAFNMDNGEEVWGFVPPYLVPSLRSGYPATRQFGVDGSPVAKEVMFERSASTLGDPNAWRTVLVSGLRGGGGAYVALDVTDPYNPQFLWQFTDTDLRTSSGTPAIGTLFFTPVGSSTPVERAVAFIPGGAGAVAGSCSPTANPRPAATNNLIRGGWTGGRGAARAYTRCWQSGTGQYFYVVDLQTGRLIRKIGTGAGGLQPTGSPLTGAPALFNGLAGAVTTRAYTGDADGTLWRVDFTSRDPAQWWMGIAYDLFWDKAYNEGQPIVERPAVTIDSRNRAVIAFGSGDPELLDNLDENRVASITETTTDTLGNPLGEIRVEDVWEMRNGSMPVDQHFYPGERLTGGMTLFNNVLYFGTFVPRSSTDACEIGYARLWGVDMNRAESAYPFVPVAKLDLDGNPATTTDVVRATRDLNFNGSAADDGNTLLFGVTVARRASCNVTAPSFDPISGTTRTFVQSSTGGDYRIVLQTGRPGTSGGGSGANTSWRRVPRPVMPARVDSWATVFE